MRLSTSDLLRWAHDWGHELVLEGHEAGLSADEIVVICAMMARFMRRSHPNAQTRKLVDLQQEAEAIADAYDCPVAVA